MPELHSKVQRVVCDGVEVEKANQENQGETRRVDKLNPIPWQPFYATRARGLLKDAARDHSQRW